MKLTTYARAAWVPAAGALLLAGGLQAQTAPSAPGIDPANFDLTVRPQDDFYRYVNGTWLRNAQIPADRSTTGAFIDLRDRSENALRTIVEATAAKHNRPGSDEQKVGDLYASVMDSARAERLGLTPLRPEMARIAALTGKAALPELFAHLNTIGVQVPFGYSIQQDAKKATEYVASLNQGGLGLPDRDYYLKPDANFERNREAYRTYLETVFRLTGDRDPRGAAQAVFAFEKSLAEASWDRARSRDREATYNRMSVAQVNALTPGFSWTRYITATGTQATPAVIVRQPDFFPAMDKALQQASLADLKRYLTFKLVDAYAPSLSSPFVNASFAFRGTALQGLQANRPRWKRAIGVVESSLGEAAGRMYVADNFRPEARARMQQLVGNLLATYRTSIDSLEWMSPATRAQAKEKLAAYQVKIGYPDKWRDYSALTVSPTDLVGNMMRVSRFGYRRMVSRLGKPVDRTEWGMTPQTVNAYYNPSMNEIVFPAAILQPPFFTPTADDAVNYGGIGAVIGHEISHGFDDQGRRSDGEGNMRDWWTAADAQAFDARATALANEYSAFEPVQGTHVNGRLTLGENIGDLSGIAVALKAYHRSLNGQPAPVINGLTGDQRFFLAFAQIWRSRYRDEALRQQLLTDPHSPGEFRTNGILRNIPEFYAAFNVQPGDKMYVAPEQRVKIW
jgi:predicted metalloendopeptidase